MLLRHVCVYVCVCVRMHVCVCVRMCVCVRVHHVVYAIQQTEDNEKYAHTLYSLSS